MTYETLNKERVMISICEIYHNNSSSVLEIPDFRRSWNSNDELFKNPIFPKKNIYTNPSNVESYLQSIPVDTRKLLLENNKGLFSIMYLHYEKAAYALDRFESEYGHIGEFFKGIPAQMAAYTLYTFNRTHCQYKPDNLIFIMDKNWKFVNDSKESFNLEFPKSDYQMYRDVISQRFADISKPKIEPEKPEKKESSALNFIKSRRNV